MAALCTLATAHPHDSFAGVELGQCAIGSCDLYPENIDRDGSAVSVGPGMHRDPFADLNLERFIKKFSGIHTHRLHTTEPKHVVDRNVNNSLRSFRDPLDGALLAKWNELWARMNGPAAHCPGDRATHSPERCSPSREHAALRTLVSLE